MLTTGLWYYREDSLSTMPPKRSDERLIAKKKVVLVDNFSRTHRDTDFSRSYPFVWCVSSTLQTVTAKALLDSFPFPVTVSACLLLFASGYTLCTWFTTTRRIPSVDKLRSRHWRRLVFAAFFHGVGSVLAMAAIMSGPVSTSVLLKAVRLDSLSSLATVGSVVLSSSQSSSLPQLFYSVASVWMIRARSRVRISSSHRFQGSQNLFGVVCMISLAMALPLIHYTEKPPLPSLLQMGYLIILGVTYVVSNEVAFQLSHDKSSDVLRRACSWFVSGVVFGELTPATMTNCYYTLIGALCAFGGSSWAFKKQQQLPKREVVGKQQRVRTSSESTFDSFRSASTSRTAGSSSMLTT